MIQLTIGRVENLLPEDEERLRELVEIFNYHQNNNEKKFRYYDGKIKIGDVNIGIAMPDNVKNVRIGCEWGTKCIDVLAAKSVFDGFVSENGETVELVNQLIKDNKLIPEYKKATKDELTYGCTFVTLSRDPKIKCRIRMHSPRTAAARWNGELNRIDCGLAIIDSVPDEKDLGKWSPSLINIYTDTHIIVMRRNNNRWSAEYLPQKMGRPLMEPLIYNATNEKPFGRSRLKYTIRGLIDSHVRTIVNATIGLEFSTTPQKYLLGITDEQYDALINQKFRQYIGSLMMATQNPDTGQNPTFGQLQQGTIQPHVDMMRILATQFSAASGLTVTDVGVINDANPTSAEAIIAQSGSLIDIAEEINDVNGASLEIIMKMAYCIATNTTLETIPDEAKGILPHFKNPAMPSLSTTADAAIKIASSRENFAGTDMFLEMIGFDQADIRRIKSQEQRIAGQTTLKEFMQNDNNNAERVDQVQETDESDLPAGS